MTHNTAGICTFKVLTIVCLFPHQALSKAEGGTRNELSSLEAEADMPLEQLLAQYGYIVPTGPSNAEASSSQAQVEAATTSSRQQRRKAKEQPGSADRPAKRQRTSLAHTQVPETDAADCETPVPPAPTSHPQSPPGQLQKSTSSAGSDRMSNSGSDGSSADLRSLVELPEQAAADTAVGVPSRNGPAANRPMALGALVKSPTRDADETQSGSDFNSVAGGSDDADDDEQTLEEEERLAQAEGSIHNVGCPWLTVERQISLHEFRKVMDQPRCGTQACNTSKCHITSRSTA